MAEEFLYVEVVKPHKRQKLTFKIPSNNAGPSGTSVATGTENQEQFLEMPPRLSLIDSEKFDFPENQTPLVDNSYPDNSEETENLNPPEIQETPLDTTPKRGSINGEKSKTTKTQRLSVDNTVNRGSFSTKPAQKVKQTTGVTSKGNENVNIHGKSVDQPPGHSAITKKKTKMVPVPLENQAVSSSITGEKSKIETMASEKQPARSSITGEKSKIGTVTLESQPARSSITGDKLKVETIFESQSIRSSITGDKSKIETILESQPARSSITGRKSKMGKIELDNTPPRSPIITDHLRIETTPLDNAPPRSSISGDQSKVEATPLGNSTVRTSITAERTTSLENPSVRHSITSRRLKVQRMSLESASPRGSISRRIKIKRISLDGSSARSSIASGKYKLKSYVIEKPSIHRSLDDENMSADDMDRVHVLKLERVSDSELAAGASLDSDKPYPPDTQRLSVDSYSDHSEVPTILPEDWVPPQRELIVSSIKPHTPFTPRPAPKPIRRFREKTAIRKNFQPIKTKPLTLTYTDFDIIEQRFERRRVVAKSMCRPYSNIFKNAILPIVVPLRRPLMPDIMPKKDQRDNLILPLINVKASILGSVKSCAIERAKRNIERMLRTENTRHNIFAKQKNMVTRKFDSFRLCELLDKSTNKKPNVDTRSVRGLPRKNIMGIDTNIWPKYPVSTNLHNLAKKDDFYHNLDIKSTSCMDSCEQASITYSTGINTCRSLSEKEINKNTGSARSYNKGYKLNNCKTDTLIEDLKTTEKGVHASPKYGRRSKPDFEEQASSLNTRLEQDKSKSLSNTMELESKPVARSIPVYGRRSKPNATDNSLNKDLEAKKEICKVLSQTSDVDTSLVKSTPLFGRRSLPSKATDEMHSPTNAQRNGSDHLDLESLTSSHSTPKHGRRAIQSNRDKLITKQPTAITDMPLHGEQHKVDTKSNAQIFCRSPPNTATTKFLTTETESLPTIVKMKGTFTPSYASTCCSAVTSSYGGSVRDYDNVRVPDVPLHNKTSADKVVCVRPQIKGLARMNAKQLKEYRQELLYNLPTYTKDDILKERKSYDQYICKKLDRDNLPEASVFIGKLVQFDDERRKRITPGIPLGTPLKHNQVHLNRLNAGLRESAAACAEGRYGFASEIFLRMAVIFMHNDEWWWLAQQLFDISIMFGQKIRDLLAKHEAMARYVFGMFLFRYLNILDEAEDHLNLAVKFSIGMSWKATILDKKQDTIFHESSSLLNRINTERSYRALFYESNPAKATELALKSLKLGLESDNVSSKLAATFQLARCYKANKDLDGAIKILKKYVSDCNHAREFDSLCAGHRELAECFIEKGDAYESFASLIRYRSVSKNHERKAHQAEASLYIGRYHWGQRQLDDALTFIRESFMLFFQLQMTEEVEITRTLFAMVKGEGLLKEYMSLVKRSQHEVLPLKMHLNWKDRHVPFWEVDKYKNRSADGRLRSALKSALRPEPKPIPKPEPKWKRKLRKILAKASKAKTVAKTGQKPSKKSSTKSSKKSSKKSSAKSSAKSSMKSSMKPSTKPIVKPILKPSVKPSVKLSVKPIAKPSVKLSTPRAIAKPSTPISSAKPKAILKPKSKEKKESPEKTASGPDSLRQKTNVIRFAPRF